MDLIADLFPAHNALPDPTAASKIAVLRAALFGGNLSDLEAPQEALAQRIDQAAQKIGSGAEIARISELTTLAQFGPASIGAAVAQAYDDEHSAPIAEAMFVARFLVEVVFAGARSPNLLPGDMLKQHQVNRAEISWPAAKPVYQGLLTRARETINRAEAMDIRSASPELRKMLARYQMQTVRQIARLEDRDPASPGARLTRFDNLMISLRLLLRIRETS
ncbi:MAG: hypothetical protein OSB76_15220 [Alphaproteobacteria bacterium]|nr:hypothetical protein [Alphaproteobacteria bacterium]